MMVVRTGWVLLGMLAGGVSAIGAYRFFTMTCDNTLPCGLGTAVMTAVAFLAAMICLTIADAAKH